MSVESSLEIRLVLSTYSFFPFENSVMSQAVWMLINHISRMGEIIPNLLSLRLLRFFSKLGYCPKSIKEEAECQLVS